MRPLTVVAAVLLMLTSGCGGSGRQDPTPRDTAAPSAVVAPAPEIRGVGKFDYDPGGSRPSFTVHYAAPGRVRASSQVLVVMPGMERNAADYRDTWTTTARRLGLVVLVPELPEDQWSSTAYNLGGLTDEDGEPLPQRDWTFTMIRRMAIKATAWSGSRDRRFSIFGHSAGAQFVHRYVEFSHARLEAAVAANAGWYTLPDDDVEFPYGLDGVPLDEDELRGAFRARLTVLLGADDIDPDDESLRDDDQANDQGPHRLARGLYFYEVARETADDQDLRFNWALGVVPGVAHESTGTARAAVDYLFPDSRR